MTGYGRNCSVPVLLEIIFFTTEVLCILENVFRPPGSGYVRLRLGISIARPSVVSNSFGQEIVVRVDKRYQSSSASLLPKKRESGEAAMQADVSDPAIVKTTIGGPAGRFQLGTPRPAVCGCSPQVGD